MKRNLAKLVQEIKRRSIDQPVSRVEADLLIAAIETQERQVKIAALKSKLQALRHQ